MTIVAADLRFLSSERMTDELTGFSGAQGGGAASGPVVLTGVPNSVFPPAMPSALVTGRRQLRLLYPAVLSNNNTQASTAGVAVYQRAADAAVSLFAFTAAAVNVASPSASASVLGDVDAAVASAKVRARTLLGGPSAAGNLVAAGGNALSGLPDLSAFLAVGDKVSVRSGAARVVWRTVTAFNGPAGTLTFSGTGLTGAAAGQLVELQAYGDNELVISAPGHTTASVAAGAQQVVVDRLEVRVLPTAPAPVFTWQADEWRTVANLGGLLPMFAPGATVLVDDPANGTAPEVRVIESVNYATGVVRFTASLANAYATGTRVSRLLDLGTLQARVVVPAFTQQAWTRTWADTPTGATLAARYTGTIAMNNAGGITDRWAIVFSSATNFNLVSERFGQIAAGNTASNFVPLNPLTSQPYFTLPASGWGSGWLQGNVVRFNTQGAHAGVWYGRCIAPGAAGADEGGLIIRADV